MIYVLSVDDPLLSRGGNLAAVNSPAIVTTTDDVRLVPGVNREPAAIISRSEFRPAYDTFGLFSPFPVLRSPFVVELHVARSVRNVAPT